MMVLGKNFKDWDGCVEKKKFLREPVEILLLPSKLEQLEKILLLSHFFLVLTSTFVIE